MACASCSPIGIRSDSSPPVPCSNSRTGAVLSAAGRKRCRKPKSPGATELLLLSIAKMDDRQAAQDVFAHWLELGRQGQFGTEMLQRFIHGEAGRIGRDLEQ